MEFSPADESSRFAELVSYLEGMDTAAQIMLFGDQDSEPIKPIGGMEQCVAVDDRLQDYVPLPREHPQRRIIHRTSWSE